MKLFSTIIFLLLVSTCSGQELSGSPTLLRLFSESLSLEVNGGQFVRHREYGTIAGTTVDACVLSLPKSIAGGGFFSGDLSVRGTLSLGTRSRIGRPFEQYSVKSLSAGLKVPLLNLSPLFGIDNDVAVHASPFYERAIMKNPLTRRTSALVGLGIAIGVTAELTDSFAISSDFSYVRSNPGSARFLWGPRYETIRFGVVFKFGELMKGVRRQQTLNRMLARENSTLKQAVTRLESDHESLYGRTEIIHDSLRKALAALAELVKEAEELKANAAQRAVVHQTVLLVPFDESQRPATRVIRIDKMLFDKEDLIEEDYLKAILSILSNHDSYVWEIAYRDSVSVDGVVGERLAGKIKDFFQIYHSNFNKKLRITLDSSMKAEFEIRCLGRELAQAGNSSSN